MKKLIALLLCMLMVGAVLAGCGEKVVSKGKTDAVPAKETQAAAENDAEDTTVSYEPKTTDPLLSVDQIPAANLDAADASYQKKAPAEGEEVAILHTNYGDISFKFFPEVAPKAVYSFIALAKAGRYDNTIFHRVINNFMIQGGDYTNFNGTGGESAYGEGYGLEVSDYLSNIEGAVAMANTGRPNSNGSQFYINQVNNNNLDGNYTVFGQVYDGMDVVNKIANVKTTGQTGNPQDKPLQDVVLKSVEIVKYSK